MKLPSRFYAIIDPIAGHEPTALAAGLIDAGARMLQLRCKTGPVAATLRAATAIAAIAHKADALFVVNDRPDVALLAGADGVHVGQTDLPAKAARRLLGAGSIVGVSTHSLEQALEAERAGADYIGFGPMFAGGSRNTRLGQGLEALRIVRAEVKLPIVAIGGITELNAAEVLAAGADAVAIISDVVNAPDLSAKVKALLAHDSQ